MAIQSIPMHAKTLPFSSPQHRCMPKHLHSLPTQADPLQYTLDKESCRHTSPLFSVNTVRVFILRPSLSCRQLLSRTTLCIETRPDCYSLLPPALLLTRPFRFSPHHPDRHLALLFTTSVICPHHVSPW